MRLIVGLGNPGPEFQWTPHNLGFLAVDEIANRCKEVESGARNVDHILTRTLLPDMSNEFLSRMATGEPIARVAVAVGEGGQTRRAAGAPNCRGAQVIDAERFLAFFFDRLCPAAS